MKHRIACSIPMAIFFIFTGSYVFADVPKRQLAICEIAYFAAGGGAQAFPTRGDRECTFTVRFADSAVLSDHVYSCTVPSGQTSCTVALDTKGRVDPQPVGVSVRPYLDPVDNADGCAYVDGSPMASLGGSAAMAVSVTHRYDCYKLQR